MSEATDLQLATLAEGKLAEVVVDAFADDHLARRGKALETSSDVDRVAEGGEVDDALAPDVPDVGHSGEHRSRSTVEPVHHRREARWFSGLAQFGRATNVCEEPGKVALCC